MKKFIVILYLLHCSGITPYHFASSIEPIKIESKILAAVDGNARIIKMGDFLFFQKQLQAILARKMPTKKMPDCTFKTLVATEDNLPTKNRDAILHKFIHQFAQTMQHNIFDDLKLVQSEVNHIIHDWSLVRNRPDTPLTIFSTKEYQTDHEAGLKKYITTLTDFDTLLEDLHLFFDDLIVSLPKSYQLYQSQELLKEQQLL